MGPTTYTSSFRVSYYPPYPFENNGRTSSLLHLETKGELLEGQGLDPTKEACRAWPHHTLSPTQPTLDATCFMSYLLR